MRTTLYSLLSRLGPDSLPRPVVEFGAARVAGQERRPPTRRSFGHPAFFAADLAPGPGIDHVQDLHQPGLRTASVGTAILFDTVEHVRRPWRAMEELRRLLRPDGLLVMTSVFYFPVHAHPDDYWRFTASGFAALVEDFEWSHAIEVGDPLVPHTVAAVAGHRPVDAARFTAALDGWAARDATSWKERVLMAAPPRLTSAAYRAITRRSAR